MKKGIARIVIGIILIVLQLLSLFGSGGNLQISFASLAAFLSSLVFLLFYFLPGIIGVILLVWEIKAYQKSK